MSTSTNNKLAVVILAAGHGTRMKSELPKVVHTVNGVTMIEQVVTAVEDARICDIPIVVVNPNHTYVQDVLGNRATYVVQDEQLGTGHAVSVTEQALKGHAEHVLVLYGDMPFVSSESLSSIVNDHTENSPVITLVNTIAENFDGWRKAFYHHGRIIRDEHGNIVKNVELRDANEEQKKITEVWSGIMCFKAEWLWNHIHNLQTDNDQNEYYLTDLIEMASVESAAITSSLLPNEEVVGINSKDDLENAQILIS